MTKKLDKTAWLERRRSGIGGSDMAAILGISPWKSPLNVWLDKTETGTPVDLPTVRMRVGTALEPLAAEMYEEQTGRKVRRCNALLHKEGTHLVGNVDRLCYTQDGKLPWSRKLGVVTDLALEIKTSSDLQEWDDVPDHYKAQALHYMNLMPSVKAFDFPVLFIAKGTFRIYTVERDEDTIRDMESAAEAFWRDYVETRTPPPATNEDDANAIWPRHAEGKVAVADERIEHAVESLRHIAAEKKALDQKESEVKLLVQEAMQDAEAIVLPDGRKLATWKTSKDSEKVDYKAAFSEVAAALGDASASAAILAAHTAVKPGARIFRLSSGK